MSDSEDQGETEGRSSLGISWLALIASSGAFFHPFLQSWEYRVLAQDSLQNIGILCKFDPKEYN